MRAGLTAIAFLVAVVSAPASAIACVCVGTTEIPTRTTNVTPSTELQPDGDLWVSGGVK